MSKRKQSSGEASIPPKDHKPEETNTLKITDHKSQEQQALTFINQKKLNEAEAIYTALALAGSKNHIVHGNLGALLKMRGDISNSITCFKEAIKIRPDIATNHYNLGISLQEIGNFSEAIKSYNNALKIKPNYPDAQNNLGNALRKQGDLTAAIARD